MGRLGSNGAMTGGEGPISSDRGVPVKELESGKMHTGEFCVPELHAVMLFCLA